MTAAWALVASITAALVAAVIVAELVRFVRSSWRRITAGMPDPGYPLDDEWGDGVGE